MDKTVSIIIGLTVLVFGGIIFGSMQSARNYTPGSECVQHSNSLSMHIHPELEIYLEDSKVAIPAEIGVDPSCMRAVHTHDETGKIHVESPQLQDFKLSTFFAIWGMPFSKDHLMDKTIGETHTITMTVDGQPSEEFENLVMRDGQKIVIRYSKK